MKTITIIFFTVILNSCGTAQNAATNLDKETNVKTAQTSQDDSIVIEYSAITRGTYKMVKVDSKTISFQNNRADKPASKAFSKEDWSSIMKHKNSFKLEDLNTFEPPTKAHQYDGAAIASLKITKDGKTYQTQSFDGGNPPKEIANLVNSVLELAKTEKTKGN